MADFYRVKNGNWDLAESWATASGGGTYHAAPPTSSDNVFFDANTPTGTHTINIAAYVKTLNCTGFTGTLVHGAILHVNGNVTLVSGMTFTSSSCTLMFDSSGTLTTAGKKIATLYVKDPAVVTLGDDISLQALTVYTSNGIIHNNKKIEYYNTESGNKTGGFVYTSNQTDIVLYDLVFEGTGNNYVTFDCSKLTIEHKLTISPTAFASVMAKPSNNTKCELDIADGEFNNISFCGIKGSGAFDWDLSAETAVGDGGFNEGITFPSAITMYWVGPSSGAGWRGGTTYWKTSSGGVTSVSRLPLPQDTLVFDANSFPTTGLYISFEHGSTESHMPAINALNVTNAPEFRFDYANSSRYYFAGNFQLSSEVTLKTTASGSFIFCGISSDGEYYIDFGKKQTIGSGGVQIYTCGKFYLSGNLSINRPLNVRPGAFFDFNDYNAEIESFESNSGATVSLGTGTITITRVNAAYPWNIDSSTTLNTETSKLIFKGTKGNNFYDQRGSGVVYNTIELDSSEVIELRSGSAMTIDYLIIKRSMAFYSTYSFTINKMYAIGTPSSKIAVKSRDTTPVTLLIGSSPGKIWCNHLDVDYLTSTDTLTWYMGAGSTDGGHNGANILFSSIYTDPAKASLLLNFLN